MNIKYFFLFLIILFPIITFAQIKVEGKIYDAENNSLIPYVNIYILDDDNNGIVSSSKGHFSFETANEKEHLVFSHISYEIAKCDIKELLTQKDSIKVYLKPKNYLLNTVDTKPEYHTEKLKTLLKKFDASFRGGYAIANCILSNTSKYNNKYMSFFESAGFIYYTPTKKNDEMIFLPFNTRASNVVYPETEDYNNSINYKESNNFASFKKDFSLYENLGPLHPRNFNSYTFFYDAQQSTDEKLIFSFKENRRAKFECNGKIQFDLKNNIVDWVKIGSILSERQLKIKEKKGTAPRSNTLEVYYQHKNNQIHYKKLVSKMNWHLQYEGSINELELDFYDFPNSQDKSLYKNPGNGTSSTFMLYGTSLVRIYYDKQFWSTIKKAHHSIEEIRSDLEVDSSLEEQFEKNHLKYAPELDSKRFFVMDSLFQNGTYSHKIHTNNDVIENSDYLSRYKITDSYIRPFIIKLNKKADKSWTK